MIKSIRHKGLLRLFVDGDRRGVPTKWAARMLRILDRLDTCKSPKDMDLTGYRFHALKGPRQGTFSVTVSGNLRITFRFDMNGAYDVDLEDYH